MLLFKKVMAAFMFSTNAFMLDYEGDFIDTFRPFDLFIGAHLNGPGFAFNFAGIGNETLRSKNDLDSYRVFQESASLHVAIKKRLLSSAGSLRVNPFIERSKIKYVSESFFIEYNNLQNIY
jgi:hypothetical protein